MAKIISGEVFDIAVDIRKDSKTYEIWVDEYLNAVNKKKLWISEGFAQGFLVLSEFNEFCFKTTNYCSPDNKHSIKYNDLTLAIRWPKLSNKYFISGKDVLGSNFKDIK